MGKMGVEVVIRGGRILMHVFLWDLFRVCVACLICFDLAGGKGREGTGGKWVKWKKS